MQTNSQSVFSFAYRFRMGCQALAGIIAGIFMLLSPYRFFGLMMWLLPYIVWAIGLYYLAVALRLRDRLRKYMKELIMSLLIISSAGLVFWKIQWRDVLLWYFMAFYVFYSAYQLWRPVRARGIDKQQFWRWLGGLTAGGFGFFLLFMPRSGLAEALRILGGFLICWGFYQLLLPPPRE